MEIVDIRDEDVETVIEMWRRCGLVVPWNDPREDIVRCRAHENATVLVGRLEEDVSAAVMVGHDGHRGYIYYLAVYPDRQGRGLGRKMVTAAEAWLLKRDIPKIQFMIRTDNLAVRGFYEALGFEEKPFVLMQKWLTSSESGR